MDRGNPLDVRGEIMKIHIAKLLLVAIQILPLTGCVYLMDMFKPPRETWKAEQQSKSGTPPSSTVAYKEAQDVDVIPVPNITPRQNAYAVVIGIEEYREQLPKAQYATRDAKILGEYLTKVLGYPEKNVVVRVNEKAAKADLEKYFGSWLHNNVEPGSSVFIYYSGHGAPNLKKGDAYLVPYDGDPSYLENTGYPVKRLYEELSKLPAKEVVVMLDSCFSGAGGRSVIAKGAKPIGLSLENALVPAGKIAVLSASSGDQISMAHQEKGHGLFTYFVLKALQKGGYTNSDGSVKLRELFEFVKPEVERIARKDYNSEQTPQLVLPSAH